MFESGLKLKTPSLTILTENLFPDFASLSVISIEPELKIALPSAAVEDASNTTPVNLAEPALYNALPSLLENLTLSKLTVPMTL